VLGVLLGVPAGRGGRRIGARLHQVGAVQRLLICIMFIAGGGVLLWIDRLDLKPRHDDVTQFSLPMYFASACASASP